MKQRSDSEIIEAIGDRRLATMFGLHYKTVRLWMRNGIPPDWRELLTLLFPEEFDEEGRAP